MQLSSESPFLHWSWKSARYEYFSRQGCYSIYRIKYEMLSHLYSTIFTSLSHVLGPGRFLKIETPYLLCIKHLNNWTGIGWSQHFDPLCHAGSRSVEIPLMKTNGFIKSDEMPWSAEHVWKTCKRSKMSRRKPMDVNQFRIWICNSIIRIRI